MTRIWTMKSPPYHSNGFLEINNGVSGHPQESINMVCAKCQRLQKSTELATPGVKRKNELYYGSPSSSTNGTGDKSKSSATLGSTGAGKVRQSNPLDPKRRRLIAIDSKSKLLGKGAKNPYAAYSSSCSTCKTKTEQGRKYCHRCAYKANGTCHDSPSPLLLAGLTET